MTCLQSTCSALPRQRHVEFTALLLSTVRSSPGTPSQKGGVVSKTPELSYVLVANLADRSPSIWERAKNSTLEAVKGIPHQRFQWPRYT